MNQNSSAPFMLKKNRITLQFFGFVENERWQLELKFKENALKMLPSAIVPSIDVIGWSNETVFNIGPEAHNAKSGRSVKKVFVFAQSFDEFEKVAQVLRASDCKAFVEYVSVNYCFDLR